MMLEGRPVAKAILSQLRDDIAELVTQHGKIPNLTIVESGDDPSALAYARAIRRTASRIGLPCQTNTLPASLTVDEFDAHIAQLNRDPSVGGIIVLQPLPRQIPKTRPSEIVSPSKDVDGMTLVNIGLHATGSACLVPSTPAGGMEILRYYQIPIAGRKVAIVGRSLVVGKPLAMMMLAEDATVTICHSRTPDIAQFTRGADIVALAAGKPGVLTSSMVGPQTVVLDFGVTIVGGNMIGDASESVAAAVAAITPVPGGTGVVTNAILMRNTLTAIRSSVGMAASIV